MIDIESRPLTQVQIDLITHIQMMHVDDGHEVKRLSVTNLGRVVSVVVVVGMKNDEGTMAAVLCRKRGHFFIGRRGGIKAVDPSGHATKAQAKKGTNILDSHAT